MTVLLIHKKEFITALLIYKPSTNLEKNKFIAFYTRHRICHENGERVHKPFLIGPLIQEFRKRIGM